MIGLYEWCGEMFFFFFRKECDSTLLRSAPPENQHELNVPFGLVRFG